MNQFPLTDRNAAYLLGFILSFVLCYITVPLSIQLARKLGAVDVPDGSRKIHKQPTPRLGGLAIFTGVLLGSAGAVLFLYSKNEFFLIDKNSLLGIAVAGFMVLMLGMADDFKSLKPHEKFIGQVIAASILLFFGISIDFLTLPFGIGTVAIGIWSPILTVFWVVAMMNVMNFIDGLDGLAAGVSAIAGVSFFLYLTLKGNTGMALIMIATIGASLAFLRFNFFPARIFMGDSGSMFLGLIFGAVSIAGVLKSISAFALMVPIIIMGVPIIDTALAIIRRAVQNKPITEADSGHIHHKLLHRGMGHRKVVLIIYLWSALLSAAGFGANYLSPMWKIMLFVFLGVISFFILSYTGIFQELRYVLEEKRR